MERNSSHRERPTKLLTLHDVLSQLEDTDDNQCPSADIYIASPDDERLLVSVAASVLLLVFLLTFLSRQGLLGSSTGPLPSLASPGHLWTRLMTSWRVFGGRETQDIYGTVRQNTSWRGRALLLDHPKHMYFWQEVDMNHLAQIVSNGGLNISALATFSMAGYSQKWEEQLLATPPISDPLSAANETTSRVLILSRKTSWNVNDNLTVRVDVCDGHRKPLHRGGDEIRVWIVDNDNKASMTTEVTDLGNGSYYAVIPLLWPGTVQVKASITYNKEILRAIHFVRNTVKTTKIIVAGFSSNFGSASTLCSPFPFIPGYRRLCNLSDENGGLPWYCGKPRNSALQCRHWKQVGDLPFINPLPVTEGEKAWFRWLEKPQNLRIVPSKIEVKVSPTRTIHHPHQKERCQKLRFEQSWTEEAPRGYLMKEEWKPRACTIPDLSEPHVSYCLRNTTVLLLGDSNLRLTLAILAKQAGCTINTGMIQAKWHKPLLCINFTTGLEIRWRTHAMPFHIGSYWKLAEKTDQKAVGAYIDEIPYKGKFVVVVHLYLHFTPHHYSVFTTHIRTVRESVERLLQRNPSTVVVIRGPHAALQYWSPLYGGDAVGRLYTSIIKEEFRGLYGRVLFLQPWDMTVAAENLDFHPPDYVNRAIVNWMLAHICP